MTYMQFHHDKKFMNAANGITIFRMVLAIGLLIAPPFSTIFWICYLCAGLSDLLDGPVARALHQTSDLGAKLDSIADLMLVCVIAIILVTHVSIPIWLWICTAVVALLRFTGFAIGYLKYQTFSALHTYANKAAGLSLFGFPLIYSLLGMQIGGILVCTVTLFSAAEELAITISAKNLNRECRSMRYSCLKAGAKA